jgi:hypothetical protein
MSGYIVNKDGEYQVGALTSGQLFFDIQTNSSNYVRLLSGEYSLSDERWHHYVLIYNGVSSSRQMDLYIDSVLTVTTAGTPSGTYTGMTNTTGELHWGFKNPSTSNSFLGNLSEMAIWNTQLSITDIKALYESVRGIEKSGFTNDPPRLQLRDLDHRLGAYPTVARTGDPDFLGKGNSPFDDTKTVNFLSSFARAWIQFKEIPATESTITLNDATGRSKTFVFIRSFPANWENPQNYEVVLLGIHTDDGYKSLANMTLGQLEKLVPGLMSNIKSAANWNPGASPQNDPGAGLLTSEDGEIDESPKPLPNWKIPHLVLVAQKFAHAVMSAFSREELKITAHARGGDHIGRVVLKQAIPGTVGNTAGSSNQIQSYKTSTISGDGAIQGMMGWTSGSFKDGKHLDIHHSTGMLSGSGYNSNWVSNPNSLPSLFSEGEVSRDVVLGNNFQFHVSDETLSPFDESRIYIGPADNIFYKNSYELYPVGSALRPVDPKRFGSPLRDKTIISIDIMPSTDTQVWFSTGSNAVLEDGGGAGASYGTSAAGLASGINSGLVYYNFARNMWESIGDFTTGSNVDIFNPRAEVRTGSMLAFGVGPHVTHYGEGYLDGVNPRFINIARASGMPTNYAGFPISSKFDATGSQLLDMSNYITHPFLLEKVVLEWSGTVGARPANFEHTPCVASNQFFILNQYQNDIQTTFTRPDVVLNTVESPHGVTASLSSYDCTRYKELVWFGRVGVYDTTAVSDVPDPPASWGAGIGTLTALTSSKFESMDLWIPTNDSSVAPSGTFMLEKSVTCPIRSPFSVGPFHQRPDGRSYPSSAEEIDEHFFLGSLGARDLFGTPSGRSYLRSVPGSAPLVGNNAPFTPFTDGNNSGFKITPFSRYEDSSPYLLMPTDKLIVGFANQQIPHGAVGTDGSEYSLGYSGSHVSTLSAGRGKITFYGSHIRHGREYHNTVNQPLTSPAIHEALHFDNPIVDQHVVEPLLTYSGCYIDNVVAGSTPRPSTVSGPAEDGVFNDASISGQGTSGGESTYDRSIVGSVQGGTAGTTGSLTMFRSYSDNDERYLDSMPGNPADYHIANGFKLLGGYGSYQDMGFIAVGSPNSTGSYSAHVVDNLWPRAFPFEPKYRHITRMKGFSALDNKLPSALLEDGALGDPVPLRAMIALTNDITIISENGLWDVRSPGVARKMMKYYYGIGQRKTRTDNAWFASHNHRGEVANTEGFVLNADVQIRGFKYGLINAVSQKSRAVYRHDRFGQFRDLLEPRQFARYFSLEDGVMEAPVNVRFVVRDTHTPVFDPETTNCQNMSVFATSSLPFFDEAAFTLSNTGKATFNIGRMRSTMPPDLEQPVDVTVDIEAAEVEVID